MLPPKNYFQTLCLYTYFTVDFNGTQEYINKQCLKMFENFCVICNSQGMGEYAVSKN